MTDVYKPIKAGIPAFDVDPRVPKNYRAELTLTCEVQPASKPEDKDHYPARFADWSSTLYWPANHDNVSFPRGSGSSRNTVFASQISGPNQDASPLFNAQTKVKVVRDEASVDPDFLEYEKAYAMYSGYLRVPRYIPSLTVRGSGHKYYSRSPLIYPQTPLVAQHDGPSETDYSSMVHDVYTTPEGDGAIDRVVRGPLSSIFRVTDVDATYPLNIGGHSFTRQWWRRIVAWNCAYPGPDGLGSYGAAMFKPQGIETVALLSSHALGPLTYSSQPQDVIGAGPLGHIVTMGALTTQALHNYNVRDAYQGTTGEIRDWAPMIDYDVTHLGLYQAQCKIVWQPNYVNTRLGRPVKGAWRIVAFGDWQAETDPGGSIVPAGGSVGSPGSGGGNTGGSSSPPPGGNGGAGAPPGAGNNGPQPPRRERPNGSGSGGDGNDNNDNDDAEPENEQNEDDRRESPRDGEGIHQDRIDWLKRKLEELRRRRDAARGRGRGDRSAVDRYYDTWMERIRQKIERLRRKAERRARELERRRQRRAENRASSMILPTGLGGRYSGTASNNVDWHSDGTVVYSDMPDGARARGVSSEEQIRAGNGEVGALVGPDGSTNGGGTGNGGGSGGRGSGGNLDDIDGLGGGAMSTISTPKEIESPSSYGHPRPGLAEPPGMAILTPGEADGISLPGSGEQDDGGDGGSIGSDFTSGGLNIARKKSRWRSTTGFTSEEFDEVPLTRHTVDAPVYQMDRADPASENPNKRYPVKRDRIPYRTKDGRRIAGYGDGTAIDLPANLKPYHQFVENVAHLPTNITRFTRIIAARQDGAGASVQIDGRLGIGMRVLDSVEVASGIEIRAVANGTANPPDFHIDMKDSAGNKIALGSADLPRLQINADTTIHGIRHPTADGSAGQALVTDGAGQLSFADVSGEGNPSLSDVLESDSTTMSGTMSATGLNVSGIKEGKWYALKAVLRTEVADSEEDGGLVIDFDNTGGSGPQWINYDAQLNHDDGVSPTIKGKEISDEATDVTIWAFSANQTEDGKVIIEGALQGPAEGTGQIGLRHALAQDTGAGATATIGKGSWIELRELDDS